MCRVFMIPHIAEGKLAKTQQFVKEMAKILSHSEEDGVGYAAITREGKIFGEKWVNKEDAFVLHHNPEPDPVIKLMTDTFGNAAKFRTEPKLQGLVYGRHGDLDNAKDAVAVILHARKQTIGGLCVANTHPFFYTANPNVEGDVDAALIHNGSIANHEELTKITSTCDSETILNEYITNMMNHNPWAIHELSKKLYGEYAVGVLSSTFQNDETVPILDIFKSNKPLYTAWIPELETYVFCTMDYNINSAANVCNMTVQHMMEIKDGNYLRFDCRTGRRCEDIIEFDISKTKSDFRAQNSHHRPNTTTPELCRIGPANKPSEDKDETSEDVRRNFQKNHPSVFNQQYHQPGHLTEEERAFFAELEKNDATNHRALRLVAAATGVRK